MFFLRAQRTLHGFDTFKGLPETWSGTQYGKGAFSQHGKLPPVSEFIELHKGLFNETLPVFLQQIPETTPVAYANIDCDLYSGTLQILTDLEKRFRVGSILHFHDFLGDGTSMKNPTDELRALHDFITGSGNRIGFEILNVRGMIAEPVVLRVNSIEWPTQS